MSFKKLFGNAMICLCFVMLLSACTNIFGAKENNQPPVAGTDPIVEGNGGEQSGDNLPEDEEEIDGQEEPLNPPDPPAVDPPTKPVEKDPSAIQVVANSDAITVLVNKQFKLPEGYKPTDLVEPDVPFIFEEKSEKRLMRQEAATALESMFAAATKDGIYLAGVSGFRSESTQSSLFKRYVERDGEEAANQYSARPGHSEHQTGLSIDVSGSTAVCAVQDCFADTDEAKWIAKHAHKHGFIVRYPQGKEGITGYQYEPWHIRYVGKEDAIHIFEQNMTLEEHLQDAIPVLQTN